MNFLSRFMMGRRGTDQLNFALIIAAILCTFLSSIVGWFARGIILTAIYVALQFFGTAFLFLSLFRMFSRNIPARERENAVFMRTWSRVRAPFSRKVRSARDRDHVYLSCPNCRAELRVPKGKGTLLVTCPKCGHETKIKT